MCRRIVENIMARRYHRVRRFNAAEPRHTHFHTAHRAAGTPIQNRAADPLEETDKADQPDQQHGPADHQGDQTHVLVLKIMMIVRHTSIPSFSVPTDGQPSRPLPPSNAETMAGCAPPLRISPARNLGEAGAEVNPPAISVRQS